MLSRLKHFVPEWVPTWSSLKEMFQEEERPFGILVIGDSGAGKNTVINNLTGLGMPGGFSHGPTHMTVVSLDVIAEGKCIAFYKAPGLGVYKGNRDDECLEKMKFKLYNGNINLVIYCIQLPATRISQSFIRTVEEYNKLGVKWERTVIALTFSDALPVPFCHKQRPDFDMGCFFNDRVAELRVRSIRMLIDILGMPPEVAHDIKCHPTAAKRDELLPNGEDWFTPFWLDVFEPLKLPPCAVMKFQGVSNIIFEYSLKEDGTDFTESECHALYQKAITDNPTITLHIAKAMTIGPPRVGKTSLRHLLLGLPLPEVSVSTPVMKTAETVSVLSSDETQSVTINEWTKAVKAETDLIHIGSEDKWVLVNESSGIFSLLSHLKERVDKTKHGEGIQKAGAVQMQSRAKDPDSAQARREMVIGQVASQLPTADSKEAASVPDLHKVKHRSTRTRTGGTTEDSNQVFAAANQLCQLLHAPNFADVTLPDAKLVQFLDSGGQLAYHDILPIFTTIPAIYLHVFDLTKELDSCPKDQLFLNTAEGEVYSHAQSPLTVAEMMTRSVMAIKSLADKKVQLPKGVLLSDPPKPHVVFVGTHLDELAKKSKNLKPTFDMFSKALQSALQSGSHCMEDMVMKNLDHRLPSMFFPAANKQSNCLDVGSRAIKQLKRRINTFVSGVMVKVPVKWYLYQMLEISHCAAEHISVHQYRDLYKSCHLKKVVDDLKEFHTMITYFHALGLLIHACNDVAHSKDSTCLVFTDPSYLFENISKLFHVQFLEPIRCSGSLRKLKLEGKLTEKTLWDLKVDSTQLDHEAFMDVLVHFFIGADIEDATRNEGRTLFVPSVLPIEDTSQPLPTEESLHFVIAFSKKPFIPCGVYAGVIARLQSLPQWTISTASVSRSHATFGIVPGDTVQLFDCSSHIRVELDACDREKAQECRDTVLTVVSKSYCFLFHAKPTKGQPCATCREEPYLVLGMTCQHCRGVKTNHIATLEVEAGEAKAVCCLATQNARRINGEHQELFQSIQHDAVVREQHTSRPTSSRKVMMTLPPQDTAECTTEEAVLHCFKSFGDHFVKDVHSRDNPAFTVKLYRQKVIPERLKNQILAAADGETANELLFEHLSKQASGESLSKLFAAMIEAEGHPAMTKLGREMQRTLGL